MDISKEVHDMKNTLMVILFALEADAKEESKINARDAVMQVSDKLTEIEKHVKDLQGESHERG